MSVSLISEMSIKKYMNTTRVANGHIPAYSIPKESIRNLDVISFVM